MHLHGQGTHRSGYAEAEASSALDEGRTCTKMAIAVSINMQTDELGIPILVPPVRPLAECSSGTGGRTVGCTFFVVHGLRGKNMKKVVACSTRVPQVGGTRLLCTRALFGYSGTLRYSYPARVRSTKNGGLFIQLQSGMRVRVRVLMW